MMDASVIPLRWIPALPLLGALVLGVVTGILRRELSPRWIGSLGLVSVGSSMVLVLLGFFALLGEPRGGALVDRVGTWIGVGIAPDATTIDFAFRFDALSAVMCLLISVGGVFSIIHALGTQHADQRDDRGAQRFMGFICISLAMMLAVVLADDVFFFWAAWCGLGVATWWLLGFWYADPAQSRAASTLFVLGRFGDMALLAALVLIVDAILGSDGTFAGFAQIDSAEPSLIQKTLEPMLMFGVGEWTVADVCVVLILVAGITKAALFPLSRFMVAGSTAPVTALILVQTLFIAVPFIYLGARLAFVFSQAHSVLGLVGWVGAMTALVAAIFVCLEKDVLRLLAWLTVSQLGLACIALAAIDEAAAIFQLIAHAVNKGLLLMAVGVMVAAVGGHRDLLKMGNLGSRIWRTRVNTWIATLSICGILPLTVGSFAIEQILFAVASSESLPAQGWMIWTILLTMAVTSFGLMRLIYSALYGETRIPSSIRWSGIEDPGPMILWPMGILAVATFVGSLVATPQIWADLLFADIQEANSLRFFLGADSVELAADRQWGLVAGVTACSLFGCMAGVALYLYRPNALILMIPRRSDPPSRSGWRMGRRQRVWSSSGVAVPRFGRTNRLRSFEEGVIESITLRLSAWFVQSAFGQVIRRLYEGRIVQSLLAFAISLLMMLAYFLMLSTD